MKNLQQTERHHLSSPPGSASLKAKERIQKLNKKLLYTTTTTTYYYYYYYLKVAPEKEHIGEKK